MSPRIANFTLLIASVLVALVGAEWVLRARVGPPVHWRYPQEAYRCDPEVGFWLQPGQHAFTHDKRVQINSVGIRDAEFATRQSAGTQRVLAVGDSQTFGNGLELRDTWPKQLERELRQRERTAHWEVLNAGLPGSDSWQHERILKRLLDTYEADVVVLGFYVNDVSRRPGDASSLCSAVRPESWSRRVGYFLKRSAIFTALWNARRPIRAALRGDAGTDRELRILSGETDPAIETGWREVERALAAMKASAEAEGAQLLVLVMPRSDQVAGHIAGLAYNRRIAAIAGSLEVPVVDVLEPLRRAFADQGNQLFIPWDGHNSAAANQVIGRTLADFLLQRSPDRFN